MVSREKAVWDSTCWDFAFYGLFWLTGTAEEVGLNVICLQALPVGSRWSPNPAWGLETARRPRGEGSRSMSPVAPPAPRCPLTQLCRLPLAGQVVDAVSVDASVCLEKGIYLSSRKNALMHKAVSKLVWRHRFRCFETFLC